jgi:hypothetical protein
MAYGPSRRNNQTWYFSDLNLDSRILNNRNVTASDGGFTGSGTTNLSIMTSSRYKQSEAEQDHDRCKAQGFISNRYDWRDVEITGKMLFKYAGDGARCSFFARTGDITRPCEGTGYGAVFTPDGMVSCELRQWYPGGVTKLDEAHASAGDIEGKWIGFKICVFNNPTDSHVNVEVWIDELDNNQFHRMCSVTDTGMGELGERCSTNINEIITWGGPLVTFAMDGEDVVTDVIDAETGEYVVEKTQVQIKNLSVREIDPYNRFGQGGGVGGQGLQIFVPPVSTAISIDEATPLPAPDDDDTVEEVVEATNELGYRFITTERLNKVGGSYVAGDANQTLYQLTGVISTFDEGDFETRHYASGKPDTISKEWNANVNWGNVTVTMYITISDPDDASDTIAVKFRGGDHEDGEGAWYIFNIEFNTGKCGWGWEQPHPTTESFTNVGQTVGSIIDKKIGLQVVVWDLPGGGAHCESWVDTGDKIWKKTTDINNPGGKVFSASSDQKIQIRIDAAPNIQMWNLSLKQNTPGGVFVGTDGTGGTGGPPPGGGGTGGGGTGGGGTTTTRTVTQLPVSQWNDLEDDFRFTLVDKIDFIPYDTEIWEDASISAYEGIEAEPPTGYTGSNSSANSGNTGISGNVLFSDPVQIPGSSGGTGGGTGTGGTAGTISGSCGGADQWGVRATYATGPIKYDWVENFRDDGKRFDFEGMGSDYASAELIGYFRCEDRPDDEVSGKMGGGDHNDGSSPKVYDIGVGIFDGKSRIRLEEDHPFYFGERSGGTGEPLSETNFIGYKFIKWNRPNGVQMEYWQDAGSNNGTTPANQWKRISSWLFTDPNWQIPPPDHQEVIRIDGDGGVPGLEWKWISLRKILPSDTGVCGGGTGGGGTGGGGTGGGGTTPPPTVNTATILAPIKVRGMLDFGGPKWRGATVHMIFAGADWNTRTTPFSRQQVIDRLKAIFASTYFDALYQYGIKRPKFGSTPTNTAVMSSASEFFVTDTLAMVTGVWASNGAPKPESAAYQAYLVFPRSGSTPGAPLTTAVGYHVAASGGVGLTPYTKYVVVYGMSLYQASLDLTVLSATHQIVEMLANPIPHIDTGTDYNALLADNTVLSIVNGNEICDVCTGQTGTILTNVLVHKYYSNQDGMCTLSNVAPPWISCHVNATWNPITQQCEANPGYNQGGGGIPDWDDIGDGGTGGGGTGGGGGGTTDPWARAYTGGLGQLNGSIAGKATNQLVYGNVTGSITGVGGQNSLATFAGTFTGSSPNSIIGNFTGTIAGTGTGTGHSANANKTGEFVADVTGTIIAAESGSGTGSVAGRVIGIFTGITVATNPGTGTGGGTGSGGSGGTGGGTDSPTPNPATPSPLFAEASLQVTWAIDNMEGDPCSIDSPTEDVGIDEIFNANKDSNIYAETINYRRIGIYVNKVSSVFVGKKIRNVKVVMHRTGTAPLRGLIFCRIRNSKATIVEDFPDPIDSSFLTGDDITFEFNHHAPMRTIERGDFIYIEYPSGGDFENFVRVKITERDEADGEASCLVTFDGANEVINLDKDPAFIVSV